MSKLDAQRAMREAKYARTQERAQKQAQKPAQAPTRSRDAQPAPPVAPPAPVAERAAAGPATEAAADTCGHKSMNGRTCTRPAGHSEKSHRYG